MTAAPRPQYAPGGVISARTAAAILTAMPPEIIAARMALHRAESRPWWAPWRRWVRAEHLAEALGAVDYLRRQLARARSQPHGGEG